MSTGAIIAVIVAIVVVIAIVAAVTMMRGNGTSGAGLKRRFGPEYERTLARHDGDEKATRQELADRVKRYGDFEPRPVSTQQRDQYGQRWAEIQAHFVDEPDRALAEADRLIGEVAAERGYPGGESPEHFEALSVHHPYQVQGYRQAHALAEHAGAGGRTATEDMRQSLVAARALFDEMLQDAGSASSDESERSGRSVGSDRADRSVGSVGSVKAAREPAASGPGTGPDATAPAASGPAASGRTADTPRTTPTADTARTTGPAAGRTGADTGADTGAATGEDVGDGTGDRSERAAARERDGAEPDDVGNGAQHHRPLADRLAGLTGSRRDHGNDDHS